MPCVMGQSSKKNRGGSKAASGGSGGGTGAAGSGGASSISGCFSTMQRSPVDTAAKKEFGKSTGDSNLWGRIFSRPGRSLLHNEQQGPTTRSHAPSPTLRKARGSLQGGETGSAGGGSIPLTAADTSKAAARAAPPRSAQSAAASSAEERKRKSQKDRGHQSYPGERKHSDKYSMAFKAYLKRVFSYDLRASLRSRLIGWVVNLAVAAAIIGVFALKAAEEFYGQDISRGVQREEHLTALQLDASANEMDIRRAYRTLSIRWHPDKNPGCPSCQARFTEVAAAYEFLMKDFRKQKEEHGAAGSPSGAATGEDEKKTGRNDIVDFTYLSSSEPFYPATDKQVWTIMLRNGKDEYSDRVYEMWEETALALGKYVKYGFVEVHKNKSIMKRLPVKVKIFPAIFVVSHGMHPELYPAITHPSVEGIRSFISRSFPNHVSLISSASDLRTYLNTKAPPFFRTPLGWLAQPYKVVVVPSAESPVSPPVALKATAKKYRDLFSLAYVQNVRGLLLEATDTAKEDFTMLLQRQPSSAATCLKRQSSETSVDQQGETAAGSDTREQDDGACSSAENSDDEESQLGLTEKDLKNYLTVILLAKEGPGIITRVIERIRIPTLLSRRESQRVAFAKLPRLVTSALLPAQKFAAGDIGSEEVVIYFLERIHPYLYKQNAPLLCRGTPQEPVFTLVLVEPPRVVPAGNKVKNVLQQQDSSSAKQATLAALSGEQVTFKEAVALIEASRKRYAETRRGVRGAASEQQGDRETRDDREEEHETEDYAAEAADDDDKNDSSFRLQVARISLDSPETLPELPGISASSPFVDFWRNQLHSSRMFLLHLDGSRYTLLSPAANASAGNRERQAAIKELLLELYQVLDMQVQQHQFGSDGDFEEEEDGRASGSDKVRLEWHPLPAACDWTHFIKNCLPSAAAPWWWELLINIFEMPVLQLGVLSAIGISIYFFGSSLSYEALLGMLLCGSLLIGGFEHARNMYNKLWAKVDPTV